MKAKIYLLFILITFSSCFKERKIGKLKVDGIQNIFINVYQKDEFDYVTPLKYEILDVKNNIILKKSILIGTEDNVNNLNDFYAKSIDSIVYLTWGSKNEIFAIYDLTSGKGYPKSNIEETIRMNLKNSNDLVDKLKEKNPNLKANWNN